MLMAWPAAAVAARRFSRAAGLLALALALLVAAPVAAQTTTGNAGNGNTVFTAKCTACHATPSDTDNRINAANASGVITYAISSGLDGTTGMFSWFDSSSVPLTPPTPTEKNDIAAYIAGFITSLATQTVTYFTAKNITVTDPILASSAGSFTSLVAGGTAPSKGALSFAGSVITYTPNLGATGADSFTYRGSGPAGTSSERTINVNITTPAAPTVTSATTASGTGGTAFSYSITATPAGITGYGVTGALPPGVTLNSTTGVISGTPSQSGSFPVTVSATNPGGTGTQSLTITINPATPVITSAATANGTGGQAFSYTITGSYFPTGFGITGALPTGLTLDTGTGVISGTPTQSGSFAVTMSATNGVGTGNAALTVNIALTAPAITSAATASGNGGQAFSYQITASNLPASYGVTGALPTGVTLNTSTGLISGTPTQTGSFPVTISATNGAGTGTQGLTITTSYATPAISSAATASGTTGAAFSYQITASNLPASYGVTGTLPSGVTVDTGTGLVSGTPAGGSGGSYPVTVSATNPAGTGTQAVTITINFAAPTVAAKSATATSGNATPIDLASSITGSVASIAVASAPTNGSTLVAGTVVTYTPSAAFVGTDTFTYTATSPTPGAVTSAAATVTITVTAAATAATAASMTVPLNTATALDLAPFITGTLVSGISIGSAPAHGTATMSGTVVTYTPTRNYFGTDTFTYVAHGAGGASASAAVTVTVTGRPDPRQEANVARALDVQRGNANRFANAQTVNFQQRMEALHRRGADTAGGATRFSLANPAVAARGEPPVGTTPRAAPIAIADGRAAPVPLQPASTGSAANPLANSMAHSMTNPAAASFGPTAAGAPAAAGGGDALAAALGAFGVHGIGRDSVNLGALPIGATQGGYQAAGGVSVWAAGTLRYGATGGDAASFTTDGVSIGADTRLNDRLAFGLGASYARDHTRLNDDGSTSRIRGSSVAAYGSYQLGKDAFVDAVVGYGVLDYRNKRWVAAVTDFADSRRRGDQIFGSIAAGYEWRTDGFLLSPYGRLDLSHSRLDATTESGAGLNALRYGRQSLDSSRVSLGLRAEASHQTNSGLLLPHARLEYQWASTGSGGTTIHYADQANGAGYLLSSAREGSNALVLGLGADYLLNSGLKLTLDYQTLRSVGGENSQAVSVRLSKELGGSGGRGGGYKEFAIPALGIGVDAGYTYDDNVSRADRDSDRFRDETYAINLRKSWRMPLRQNFRLVAQSFFGAEKFRHFGGLNRVSLGGQGELQYRASGAFSTPVFGLFVRLSGEDFQSQMRDGVRWSGGVSYRQPLTDRINLFGALAYLERNAIDNVFDTREASGRFNIDYRLSRAGSLYFAGEYRHGDIVSSGRGMLQYLDMAKAFARDDVFTAASLFDYRFRGRTTLSTLGYSHTLGPTDGLDLSWRRVLSTPSWQPAYVTDDIRYIVNQFSFSYLTRF